MFSDRRRAWWLPLGLVAALALSACGQWIDGKKKNADVIELSDERLKCMNQLPGTIKSFMDGRADEKDIRGSFGCLRDGFKYFRQRTRGSAEDGYTSTDLRTFFGKYFLKENNISPELADGLMQMKAAVLGGSSTSITKPEIDRMIELFKTLEDGIVDLAPHVKILLMQERGPVSEERLHEAIRQTQRAMMNVLSKIDLESSGYTFEETQKLIAALGRFIAGAQRVPVFDRMGDWLPVLEATKLVFFGERASMLSPRDWSDAVQTLVDLYEIALRFHYLLENPLKGADHMHDTVVIVDKVLTVVERSHQMRMTGRIPFSQIDSLLDRAIGQKIFKLPVSVGAFKELYRKIVVRMLDPIRRGDSRGADAFERVHLLSLRREFNVFRMNQAFVDEVARGGPVDLTALRNGLSRFDAREVAARLVADPLEQAALLGAWSKYKEMMGRERSMIMTDQLRIPVVENPEALIHGWKGLSVSNLMHSLVRLFMLGYGDNRDPVLAGCTEASLTEWYEDFRRAAIEYGAFDPRAGNSGARSHKEASFFTYSGNGDERADISEMYEFLSFLVGGGLGNTNQLMTHMKAAKCALGELDVFKSPYLDEACFKSELRRAFPVLFPNLPGLVAEVGAMNDAMYDAFYLDLMTASRDSSPVGGRVELSDLRTAVTIMHYSESLFVVHDKDRNNRLSIAEVQSAAPRFFRFLKQLSPIQNDSFVTEAFVALVFTGKKPGLDTAWPSVGFEGQRVLDWLRAWRIPEAPRAKIFRVFAVLKADLAGKKKQNTPPGPRPPPAL